MPAAPRGSKKAQKLLEKILGIPPNRLDAATKKQRRLRRRLRYEGTRLSR